MLEKYSTMEVLLLSCLIGFTSAQKPDFSKLWDNGTFGNPGLKIRLAKSGLDYVNSVAGLIVNKEISELQMDDIHRGIDGGYVEIKNIRVNQLVPVRPSYQLHPSNGLTWTLSKGKISFQGNWVGRKSIWALLPSIKASGTFNALVWNWELQVSSSLEKNLQGLPQLSDVQCQFRMSNLFLEIKGGVIGWIINLFRGRIASSLKPVITAVVCKEVAQFMNGDMNRKLRSFPTQIDMGSGFKLDYGLLTEPRLGDGRLETEHWGEISYRDFPPSDFFPVDLAMESEQNHMIRLLISDYTMNTYLNNAFKCNDTRFYVSEASFPEMAEYLRIFCNGTCLGRLFPELRQRYPESTIEMNLAVAEEPPVVVFRNDSAVFYARGMAELFESESLQSILSAEFEVTANLRFQIPSPDLLLVIKSKIVDLELQVAETILTSLFDGNLLRDFVALTKPLVGELINEYLSKGIPIPVTDGVQLQNPQVRFLPRTLQLDADIVYIA